MVQQKDCNQGDQPPSGTTPLNPELLHHKAGVQAEGKLHYSVIEGLQFFTMSCPFTTEIQINLKILDWLFGMLNRVQTLSAWLQC